MILRIVMADPAGNRTAIVRTPVPASERRRIAACLLDNPALRAEQVGFETKPVRGGAGRLEMMGGEFCGNAARSYGYLLWRERTEGRADTPARNTGKNAGEISVELSGAGGLLKIRCDARGFSYAQMPMPERLEWSPEGYPVVVSEGIAHMILEGMEPDEELVKTLVGRHGKDYPAFGMQFLCGGSLTPVVAVAQAGTLVCESSCGSGSLAAAWYLWQKMRRGGEPDRAGNGQCGPVQPRGDLQTGGSAENPGSIQPRHSLQTGKGLENGAREWTFSEPGGSIAVRLWEDGAGLLQGTMGGRIELENEIALSIDDA